MKAAEVRVLIVDDDPELLVAISSLFRSFGFTADTAGNGIEALAKLEQSPFQAVLTDIRMPGMDGVSLLKKIREKNHQAPTVIIISGYGDYSVETLYDLGANGFFAKPFGAASVRDTLKKALIHPSQRWIADAGAVGPGALEKRFASFAEMLESGEIRFGNGGFSMALTSSPPALGSLVPFSFSFREGELKNLEGVGVVRWIRALQAIGIEFTYLNPATRAPFIEWLQAQQFIPHIPKF